METISNEQKAKNMTKGFLKEGLIKKSRIQELLIKAMEWKEKQLIDRLEDRLEKQGEQKPADSYCEEHCKGFQETGKCFADGECKAKKDAENKPTQEIESFEAEHGKYYYCIKDYFCGGRKQASKGDVVQALRGLPIMSLKDASEYFLPVNNVQKPTWSEEDEKMMQFILKYVNASASNLDFQNVKMWLKSLKPQPHWKPTDEQMRSLYFAVITYSKKDDYKLTYDSLNSLYDDLKKL